MQGGQLPGEVGHCAFLHFFLIIAFRIVLIWNTVKLLPLGNLKEGQQGIIRQLAEGDLGLKLLEMGFLPGETITVEKIAPLGDPITVKVGSYLLSLRREEANVVMVQQQ